MPDMKQKVGRMQVERSIPVITIKAGTAVCIEFADTDGSFEIHYDSPAHPGQLLVKETEGAHDSTGRKGILYCEEFEVVEQAGSPTPVEVDLMSEDQNFTFAIYWRNGKCWYNREEQAWAIERTEACEYDDAFYAHEQSFKLLKNLGMSEQFTIIRSDDTP